ncbi:MAG: GNAT family N-acetyltransferase [Actinobacteria bacterium]|nr:GNAT family N-acetyltransferase [Actinomycetota bacterium]
MIPRKPLVTGRVRLVPVSVEHAEAIWEATKSSLSELRPWMAWTADASFEHTHSFTEFAEEEWAAGREYVFAISEEDEVLGTIGVHVRNPFTHSAELGYWIRTDRAGRGLVTEAGRAVVTWAFDTLGLNRLQLLAGVDNHASQQVALKLGFRTEGALRQAAWSAEEPYDCLIFGLLASDPRPSAGGDG